MNVVTMNRYMVPVKEDEIVIALIPTPVNGSKGTTILRSSGRVERTSLGIRRVLEMHFGAVGLSLGNHKHHWQGPFYLDTHHVYFSIACHIDSCDARYSNGYMNIAPWREYEMREMETLFVMTEEKEEIRRYLMKEAILHESTCQKLGLTFSAYHRALRYEYMTFLPVPTVRGVYYIPILQEAKRLSKIVYEALRKGATPLRLL